MGARDRNTTTRTSDGRWLGIRESAKPLVRAGLVLGIGLGGFFDGIVLHQILQWHHMLTSHPDPSVATDLPLNTLWDGLFHALAYAFTVGGVVLVWRARRRVDTPPSGRVLLGAALMGWGVFNLVEGLVDHHLLGVHHVWPAGPGSVLLWDVAFLAWGAAMLGVGYLVARGDSVPEEAANEEAVDEETVDGEVVDEEVVDEETVVE